MGRPIFYLSQEEKHVDDNWVTKHIQETIESFAKYLDSYTPRGRQSYTKTSVMGPVGKILATMLSGRLEDKDALVGFVINVHNLTSDRHASHEDIQNLEKAIDAMSELKKNLPARKWVRIVREIDYGVFKRKMAATIAKRVREKEKSQGK
jgi:hypothetical protein